MIRGIMTDIVYALSDNAVLNKWSNTNYDKDVAVKVGTPKEMPEDDLPAIIIGTPSIQVDNFIRSYVVPLTIAVKIDENIADTIYKGALDIAEFSEMVAEQVIKMKLKVNVYVSGSNIVFPLYTTNMLLNIEKKIPIRPGY